MPSVFATARARAAHALGGVVEGELRAVPVRHGGVRLHRVVMFDRRGVDGIDMGRAAAQTVIEVAALRVGWAALRFVRRVRVRFRCVKSRTAARL